MPRTGTALAHAPACTDRDRGQVPARRVPSVSLQRARSSCALRGLRRCRPLLLVLEDRLLPSIGGGLVLACDPPPPGGQSAAVSPLPPVPTPVAGSSLRT